MISMKRLILLGLLAVLAVGASAGSASAARSIRISPGGTVTQVSLGKVTFVSGETRIECRLTLTIRLVAGLIAPVLLIKIGEVTRVDYNECVGGEVEAILNLPWDVSLERQLLTEGPREERCERVGVLISAAPYNRVCGAVIRILRTQFQLSVFGGFARCLYEGDIGALLPLTRVSGNEREADYRMGLLTIQPNRVRLIRGFLCPASGEMRGTFAAASPAQTIKLLA